MRLRTMVCRLRASYLDTVQTLAAVKLELAEK